MGIRNADAAHVIFEFARRATNPALNQRAAYRAASRGLPIVKGDTPVDQALLRRAWRVIRTSSGARLENDSPYGPSVELGSRAHWPPWEPIVRWVARKLRVSLSGATIGPKYGQIGVAGTARIVGMGRLTKWETVRRIAHGVAKKIAEHGTPPRGMVRKNLPRLRQIFLEEIQRLLTDVALSTGGRAR